MLKETNNKLKNGGFTMLKNMREKLKNEKGLTLIEVLAVIVILAIVAAIAIPAIGNIITNSKYNAVKADAINVLNAGQMYYLDNPDGEEGTPASVTVEELESENYLESSGEIPEDATISGDKPHKLTTPTAIEFSSGKSVRFDDATIEEINGDNEKGSKLGENHTIPSSNSSS